MSNPKSFTVIGQSGRKYRVYFNPQRGHWYTAFKNGPQRVRTTLGVSTKPEATAKVLELDGPASPRTNAAATERLTWMEFQARYLKYKLEHGIADSTVSRYRCGLDAVGRYLLQLKVPYVDGLTLTILEGYPTYRMQAEKCDVYTAFNEVLVLKNAMKWASQASRGILAKNPALDWELKRPVKPKRRMYSAEEVAALEAGAKEWLRPIITTLAWTGLRIGELIALRWQDVDLKQNVLHIRMREDWKPKGRRDRAVPLHEKVLAVLKQRPLGEYVFTGPRGGKLVQYKVWARLKADQRKLNLPDGDLHGFRRYFATNMLKAGVNVDTVRQWGGWKSLETLIRYLADTSVEDSVKAMQEASRRLASA